MARKNRRRKVLITVTLGLIILFKILFRFYFMYIVGFFIIIFGFRLVFFVYSIVDEEGKRKTKEEIDGIRDRYTNEEIERTNRKDKETYENRGKIIELKEQLSRLKQNERERFERDILPQNEKMYAVPIKKKRSEISNVIGLVKKLHPQPFAYSDEQRLFFIDNLNKGAASRMTDLIVLWNSYQERVSTENSNKQIEEDNRRYQKHLLEQKRKYENLRLETEIRYQEQLLTESRKQSALIAQKVENDKRHKEKMLEAQKEIKASVKEQEKLQRDMEHRQWLNSMERDRLRNK